jgi:hypothetical protein
VDCAARLGSVLQFLPEPGSQVARRSEQPDQYVGVEGDALQGAARFRLVRSTARSRSARSFHASEA